MWNNLLHEDISGVLYKSHFIASVDTSKFVNEFSDEH